MKTDLFALKPAPKDRVVEVWGTTDTTKPPRWTRAQWNEEHERWVTRAGWIVSLSWPSGWRECQ